MAENDNPWLRVARDAHGDVLHVSSDVAKEAANLVADVAYWVDVVRGYVNNIQHHKGFSDNNFL